MINVSIAQVPLRYIFSFSVFSHFFFWSCSRQFFFLICFLYKRFLNTVKTTCCICEPMWVDPVFLHIGSDHERLAYWLPKLRSSTVGRKQLPPLPFLIIDHISCCLISCRLVTWYLQWCCKLGLMDWFRKWLVIIVLTWVCWCEGK